MYKLKFVNLELFFMNVIQIQIQTYIRFIIKDKYAGVMRNALKLRVLEKFKLNKTTICFTINWD
jgi:hypothetical protein